MFAFSKIINGTISVYKYFSTVNWKFSLRRHHLFCSIVRARKTFYYYYTQKLSEKLSKERLYDIKQNHRHLIFYTNKLEGIYRVSTYLFYTQSSNFLRGKFLLVFFLVDSRLNEVKILLDANPGSVHRAGRARTTVN